MHLLGTLVVGWKKRMVFVGLMMCLGASFVWADVAILREKGPWSGSLGSNIGLLAEPSPLTKISMVSAEVKIHLRRGEKDQLKADCTADFALVDQTDNSTDPQEFLVGFPVTGLTPKIVTVDNFSVQVNGEKPATVFRQSIALSRWESKLEDTKIYGRLAENFQIQPQANRYGVKLTNEKIYASAYIWPQKSTPGATTRVRVTYTVTLRPQVLHYEKEFHSRSDDDMIPFDDIQIDHWGETYYFFDYILVSGSTWEGPIGSETIEFTADPELGLSLKRIQGYLRSQVGYPRKPLKEMGEEAIRAGVWNFQADEGDGPRWTVRGKPDFDYLFAIPAPAQGENKSK